MNKPLTPLELQLQQYAPEMFALHMLMKPTEQGLGEQKLIVLIGTLVQYFESNATGSIIIDYSKGKISGITSKVNLTAGSSQRSTY